MKNSRIFITYKRLSSAIFSKNKAAYLGMLILFFRPFTLLLDKLFSKKITDQEITKYKIPPCVMMVSPSRSGSTIIYQALTRMLPCVYISNLHALFPRNASSYMLKRKLFGQIGTPPQNYYGYTSSLTDVCEGNEVLNQITKGNPSTDEIRRRFIEFMIYMGANKENPLIIKNVQSYKRINELTKAIPEMHFLRITRDTEQVAQSMLKAYHDLGYFYNSPVNEDAHSKISPAEFSVNHLLSIEKEIKDQLNKVPEENKTHLRYEEFCANSEEITEQFMEKVLGIESNDVNFNDKGIKLTASNRLKVSVEEANEIKTAIEKLIVHERI